MAVRIRLKRMGKIHAPYYRVVVVDSRKKRDGRVIEEVGRYNPMQTPSLIEITSDRVQYWLGVGAQPSDQVKHLLDLTGDWAKFKGAKNVVNRVQVKDTDSAQTQQEQAIAQAAQEAEKRKADLAAKKAADEAAKKAEAEKAEEPAEASEAADTAEQAEEAPAAEEA